MPSQMSSTNSDSSQFCRCGYGLCIMTTSRSSKNPRRLYYKCPRVPPYEKWNGWFDESSQKNTYVPPQNHPTDSHNGTTNTVKNLEADVASLRAQQVQLMNTVRTLKTIILAVCVVQVVLMLCMKFD